MDLGTTHTVLAHLGEVLTPSLADEGRETLLPSAVAYPPSGDVLIGYPARARWPVDPRHTLLSTKRLIGARQNSYRARRFAERHPYEIVEHGERALIRTRAGDVDPVEVAAQLLMHACQRTARDPGSTSTVITIPAAFGTEERTATLQAARLASFALPALIEEPVATAIAYLARSNLTYGVVYDLGGGTFDIAVVDCSTEPFRVVANAGDPYLGGDDVDREIATRVAERILKRDRWDLRSEPEVFARLTAACEAAKLELAEAESTEIRLSRVEPAGPFAKNPFVLEQQELREITVSLVRRTFGLCDQVLAKAGIQSRDIQAVFLAGGSTGLPGLKEMVSEYFGRRARFDIDPMHVVAIGASLAAARPGLGAFLDQTGDAAQ
ncbi:MAG: Hsp70 family protein [Sandaracinaceae bacterium]